MDSSFNGPLVLTVFRKAPEDTGNMPLNMLIVVVFPGASHRGFWEKQWASPCVIQSSSQPSSILPSVHGYCIYLKFPHKNGSETTGNVPATAKLFQQLVDLVFLRGSWNIKWKNPWKNTVPLDIPWPFCPYNLLTPMHQLEPFHIRIFFNHLLHCDQEGRRFVHCKDSMILLVPPMTSVLEIFPGLEGTYSTKQTTN